MRASQAALGAAFTVTLSRVTKWVAELCTTSALAGAATASSAIAPIADFIMSSLPCAPYSTAAEWGKGLSGEDRLDRVGHGTDVGHAVDPANDAASLVHGEDRRGLGAVFTHARADRIFVVVGPALEFARSAFVAGRFDRRLLEDVVIALAAIGAGEAARDP